MWLWLIPCVIIGTFIVSMYVNWILMSYSNFPNQIKPGGQYELDGKVYKIPDLPHMVYGTDQTPTKDRPVPMLSKDAIRDLRNVINDTFQTLEDANVEFWATGGTLISAVLWKTLMCYDDDCDIAVNWEDREYLWSPEFAKLLDSRGLETFYLKGASLNFATREMAAVRVRRKNTFAPTVDIFFVKDRGDGTCGRVVTWSGEKLTYDNKEIWESKDWLFPIQKVNIDGRDWPIGNQPDKMLDKQYGKGWNEYIKSPNPLTNSHKWAFWISNTFKAWKIGSISKENDHTKLVNPRRYVSNQVASE